MSNGRGNQGRRSHKRVDGSREAGRFITLPVSVLESQAYLGLSMHARALLLEMALQHKGDNNGRLLASKKHLESRGWKSNDSITKAKRELIEAKFIHETVMGHRPHKASWYAITWYDLAKNDKYDDGAASLFKRGAYRLDEPLKPPVKVAKNASLIPPHGAMKNASPTPPHGAMSAAIAPPRGAESEPPIPRHGTIRPQKGTASIPPHGDHLEKPSPALLWPALPALPDHPRLQ